MLEQFRKYVPFAAVIGYLMVYANKGWDRLYIDLQNITPEKLMAKWQNFAIAAGALVVIAMVRKMKLNSNIKVLIIAALYFIAGHQIATAIDPPGYGQGTQVALSASTLNPYAY